MSQALVEYSDLDDSTTRMYVSGPFGMLNIGYASLFERKPRKFIICDDESSLYSSYKDIIQFETDINKAQRDLDKVMFELTSSGDFEPFEIFNLKPKRSRKVKARVLSVRKGQFVISQNEPDNLD